MDNGNRLLVINVGSTSTKVAFFRGREPVALENIRYSSEDLVRFSSLAEQLPLREEDVVKFLEKNGIDLKEVEMVVSRGGLGRPAPAGAYRVDEVMC
ncbi:MAG TPA: butyrate kinase, partial [Syntrophales bacterium]|nr:butyrate kinase [Syntrophales bacterium]